MKKSLFTGLIAFVVTLLAGYALAEDVVYTWSGQASAPLTESIDLTKYDKIAVNIVFTQLGTYGSINDSADAIRITSSEGDTSNGFGIKYKKGGGWGTYFFVGSNKSANIPTVGSVNDLTFDFTCRLSDDSTSFTEISAITWSGSGGATTSGSFTPSFTMPASIGISTLGYVTVNASMPDDVTITITATKKSELYTRTIDATESSWSSENAWTVGSTSCAVPPDGAYAELTVNTDSTVTLGSDVTVNKLTVGGSAALTFAGAQLTSPSTTINTDVDVSGITASLGAVTIPEGKTLTIGANTQITSISGAGTLVLDGAAISISADVSTSIEIGEGGGTITATSGHIALTGLISGSGSLALNGGAGSLAVKNSANTYSGALTIASGVVYVGNYGNQNSGTASTLPASTITVKNGATLVSHITGTYSWDSNIVLEDGATLGVKDATANQLTFAGNLAVNGNATFYFHWRKDANFTGVVSGSGTLTILENNAEGGISTMTLGNTQNTFTGVYKTSERQVGNTSCNVKIIVAEGAAANAGFDLNASDDVVQFNAASDTVASVNGTAGTVSSGNESGTVLTVTGTADFSDITLQDVTVGLVETSVVTLTQSQALANGTTEIPAGATVNVVLDSLNSSCELSYFTVSEGATFKFIDPGTGEEVTSGATGTTYTPPLPVWSPVDAESVFGDEECWADNVVPEAGDIVISTSTWGENISVTIPDGFTSVAIEANTTKYTKILMADGASIPSITASGKVAFTPAILNSTNTDIGKVTTLVVDTAHADAITRDLAKEIITIGTGTAEISGVISGSGALTVSSGSTLKLTAANTRTGGVIVETGATLDISSENARLFDDSWGDWSKTVAIKVSGTLISRSWSYGVDGALGCLAANSFCVELDGGAVNFVKSVESSNARGFTVTENGGEISIADGLTFYHDRPNDGNFGIANGSEGTLTLSGTGVYKFNGYVAGVVSVASGTTLAVVADSEGTPVTSFTSLALAAGSIVDVSAAELSAVGLSLPETGVVKIALGEKPVVGKKIVTSYSLMSSFDEDKFDVGKYTLDFVPEDMTVYLGPRQCFYIIVR